MPVWPHTLARPYTPHSGKASLSPLMTMRWIALPSCHDQERRSGGVRSIAHDQQAASQQNHCAIRARMWPLPPPLTKRDGINSGRVWSGPCVARHRCEPLWQRAALQADPSLRSCHHGVGRAVHPPLRGKAAPALHTDQCVAASLRKTRWPSFTSAQIVSPATNVPASSCCAKLFSSCV